MCRLRLLLPTAILGSCAEWPTWSHLPPEPGAASDASAAPGVALWEQTEWTGPVDEAPNNEIPTQPAALNLGTGWIRQGALQGWGWDAGAEADKSPEGGCPEPSDFPPTPTGDYTGDLDWFAVVPSDDATLCATARFAPDADLPPLAFDMLLYELDECGQPVEAWRDADLATASNPEGVLGLTMAGPQQTWGVAVPAGKSRGIVLAGIWPQDDDAGETITVGWTVAVSLVDTDHPDAGGLCPTMPEDL